MARSHSSQDHDAPSSRAWAGRHATDLTAATLELYGDRCHLCGRSGATTADHVVPRSLGGTDDLDNLRPAHGSCNSSRGARTLETFRAVPIEDGREFFKRAAPPAAPRPSLPVLPTVAHKNDPDQE